jgi:hypothetical protein
MLQNQMMLMQASCQFVAPLQQTTMIDPEQQCGFGWKLPITTCSKNSKLINNHYGCSEPVGATLGKEGWWN